MVVDDHPMWRQTLRRVIEEAGGCKVVAEAADGQEAITVAMRERPQVVVMDVNLPLLGGHGAARRLLEEVPDIKVLMLSASDERSDVLAAVRAGATGYLLKTADPAEVVDAVRRVHHGEVVLPAQVARTVLEEVRRPTAQVSEERLRIVLADASALFREGIARLLEDAGFDVVGSVGTAEHLLHAVGRAAPDVVVLDAALPAANGSDDPASRLRAQHPDVAVLVLTSAVDPRTASVIIEEAGGGAGYLLKDGMSHGDQLSDAIRRVASGGSVVDPTVTSQLLQARRHRDPIEQLTERERQVLELMAEGRSNQAISDRLNLSAKAVEGHIRNMFMKLDLEVAPDDHRRVLAVLAYLRSR